LSARVRVQVDSLDGHRLVDVWLGEGSHMIGRRPECPISIDHPSVSRLHARLVVEPDRCRVVNESLSNVVRWRGREVKTEVEFIEDATIAVGDTLVHFMPEYDSRAWWLVGQPPAASELRIAIVNGQRVVGRSVAAEVVLDHHSISRQHVRLQLHRDEPVIQDLGSSNGTLVNGELVVQPVLLRSGDIVDLGDLRFVVTRTLDAIPTPLSSDAVRHSSPGLARPGTRTLALLSAVLLMITLILALMLAMRAG
jgi:pSer/pThr/pTyr-binding forkhead associated (FHA) protein